MKKSSIFIKAFVLLALLAISISTSAQTPPPPPPNQGHGSTGNKAPGDGAPTGNGTFLLVAFAAVYGGKKLYYNKKSW